MHKPRRLRARAALAVELAGALAVLWAVAQWSFPVAVALAGVLMVGAAFALEGQS